MDYKNFTLTDFLTNEYFLRWVSDTDVQVNAFWEQWIQENPEKKETIEEARRMVILMQFRTNDFSNSRMEGLLEKIHNQLKEDILPNSLKIKTESNSETVFKTYGFKVAASILLFFFAASLFYIFSAKLALTGCETAYGEVKTIILPDQSVVRLNGNSGIRYDKEWNDKEAREVWVDGEAFFSVIHTKNHQKFIVHSKGLNVEVLGTEFNLSNRKGVTKVVLNKGKVKISDIEKSKSIVMSPGEMVEFSKENGKFLRKTVDTEVYTSWRKNKLVFSKTTLSSIAQTLEDNYGMKIRFSDPELGRKKFTGTIPVKDLDILMTSISESFNLKVIRNGNEIVLIRK